MDHERDEDRPKAPTLLRVRPPTRAECKALHVGGEHDRPRSSRRGRALLAAGWFCALLILAGLGALAMRTFSPNGAMSLATISAPPRATFPPPREMGVRFCESLPDDDRQRLNAGLTVMDEAGEGPALIAVLKTHDVCLDVDQLHANSGYFTQRRSPGGRGLIAYIVLDRRFVSMARPDELAATLVHEATHARMRFDGTDCLLDRSCTLLGNGVALEDEVAAHTAEATWWKALYGPNGVATGGGAGGTSVSTFENRLLAYLEAGPEAFTRYVRWMRSDPIEGSAIPDPPFFREQSTPISKIAGSTVLTNRQRTARVNVR